MLPNAGRAGGGGPGPAQASSAACPVSRLSPAPGIDDVLLLAATETTTDGGHRAAFGAALDGGSCDA